MSLLLLIGRILFGGFFLMAGINHFKKKKELVGYARKKKAPSPELMVPLTGFVLIFSALTILLGAFMELGYFALIVFLIGTNLKMHDFWNIKDKNEKKSEIANFMKNIALIGALFMLLYFGGPWPLSI